MMTLIGSGCSSSKTTEVDEFGDSVEVSEAGTDAAPEAGDQLAATPSETDSQAASVGDSETHAATEGDSLAAAPQDESTPKSIDETSGSSASLAATSSGDSSSGSEVASTPSSIDSSSMPQSTGEVEDYTVKSGDTLMRIAFEVYGDLFQWKKIYEMNKDKVTDPNNLKKGLVLKVEKMSGGSSMVAHGDEKYLIKQGDTLGTISDDVYGTPRKWRKLYEQNKSWIKDPNRIFAGFYLYYTLTPDERSEAERLKQEKGTGVSPLAGQEASDSRHPASGGVAK